MYPWTSSNPCISAIYGPTLLKFELNALDTLAHEKKPFACKKKPLCVRDFWLKTRNLTSNHPLLYEWLETRTLKIDKICFYRFALLAPLGELRFEKYWNVWFG